MPKGKGFTAMFGNKTGQLKTLRLYLEFLANPEYKFFLLNTLLKFLLFPFFYPFYFLSNSKVK